MLKGKKSKILVAYGESKYLKDLFKVSYVTVGRALNGSGGTDLQRRIRKAAIERGGLLINEHGEIQVKLTNKK